MEQLRDTRLDLLRVISTVMVVILHVAAQGFYVFYPYWGVALLYNAFGRVAVPVLFMISGVCLIPKDEPMGKWLVRLLRRALIPYVCWSAIYIVYNMRTNSLGMGTEAFAGIFAQAPYFHLGFMLQYITFQLALPLLRGFWNNERISAAAKRYVILASLGYGCLAECLQPLLGRAVIGFPFSCLPYYIGMALLGAYYKEHPVSMRRMPLLLAYAACSLLTAGLTAWKSFQLGQPTELFFVYSSPVTLIGASCLFNGILSKPVTGRLGCAARKLAPAAFSVYLMHPLFLNAFGAYITWNTLHPAIWIPAYALAVIVLCILAHTLFRKGAAYLAALFCITQ